MNYFFLFSLFISLSNWASDLAKLWSPYNNIKSIESKFSQVKEIKNLPIPLKSEGFMKITRPNYLKWVVKQPAFYQVIFDRHRIELYDGQKKTSISLGQVSQKSQLSSLSHLKAWLELDYQFIEKNYKIEKISDRAFKFRPYNFNSIEVMELELSKKGLVKKLVISEKSGDSLVLTFSDTKVTQNDVPKS